MIGCVSGVNIYTVKCKGAPRGGVGGLEGVLVLYYQKSCVISIPGFSIMGNSKMISIFILGFP